MANEQRRHVRYRVETKTYVALGEEYSRVGRVEDISWGGLAFGSINNSSILSRDHSKISIVVAENGFYLPDVSCRVVHRTPVLELENAQDPGKSFQITLCGVKFGSLEKEEKELLRTFLEKYSTFIGAT